MKKLLILIVAFCGLTSLSANAQIQIQQSFTNNLIIIGNITSGEAMNVLSALNGTPTHMAEHKLYCRIFKDKTTYGILVDTENRVDDDFEFALGKNINEAKTSLNTILGFMQSNPLNTSITVKDEDNRTIQINLKTKKGITLQAIDANGAIICNDVRLTRKNLERALLLLDSKAERAVAEAISKNNR